MFGVIAAIVVSAAGALWIYVRRERLGVAGVGLAALRTLAVALLAGLLLNPVRLLRDAGGPPVVLLDASLSMQAAGGRWDAALDSARAIAGPRGTLLRFGVIPTAFDTTAPTAAASRLGPALAAAAGLGGPVTVITDGEIGDAAAIPSALRALATTVVLPRDSVHDVAVMNVQSPARIAEGDTIRMDVTLRRWGRTADTAGIAVWAGDRRVADATVRFGGAATGRASVALPARVLGAGLHRLRVTLTAPDDAEPRTDERYRLVEVSALPAVALIAAPAGWEATFLARELRDIIRAPVGAWAQLTATRWIDLATQQPVPVERVGAAVRAARMVVRVGTPALAATGRPTWSWQVGANPARTLPGEWYPGAPPASPLAGRLAGIAWDSLPPLSGVAPVAPTPAAWTGLAARLARRGAERPIVLGYDSAGVRTLVTAGDGLWRWSLRGGAAREAYRGLVAAGTDWLLGSGVARDVPLMLASPVVGRGEPLVFRWTRGAPPDSVDVMFTAAGAERAETLRFDAAGEARVALEVGFWDWRSFGPSVSGVAAVEPYSAEFLPTPVTVEAGPATAGAGARTAGLREWWWLYLLIAGVLLGEWGWRMRKGLP